jgi:hypothetical protein
VRACRYGDTNNVILDFYTSLLGKMIEGGGMTTEPVELVAVVGPPDASSAADPADDAAADVPAGGAGGDDAAATTAIDEDAPVSDKKVRLVDAIRTKEGFIAHITALAERALGAMPQREDPGAVRERVAAEELAAKEKEEKAKGKKKPKKGEPVEEELLPPTTDELDGMADESIQKALFSKVDDECHVCLTQEDARFAFRVELVRRAAVRAASQLWVRADQLWAHMDTCAKIR